MIGHFGMANLKENIQMAIKYGKGKMAGVEKDVLEARQAPYAGPHALPWGRPGYRDGGIIV